MLDDQEKNENGEIYLTNDELLGIVNNPPCEKCKNPYDMLINARIPDVPMKTLVKIQKLMKSVSEAVKDYDNIRRKTAEYYAEKDEKGDPITEAPKTEVEIIDRQIRLLEERKKGILETGKDKEAPKDQWHYKFDDKSNEVFMKKIMELLACESSLNGMKKINLKYSEIEKLPLSAIDIELLSKLVNFVDDEDEN